MSEKRFSKGEAIAFGWNTMKENFWFFVLLSFVAAAVTWTPGLISEGLKKPYPLMAALFSFAGFVLSVWLAPAVIKIYLKFSDGQKGQIEDLFAYPQLVWPYFLGSLLVGLATIVGFIFLIIPGIYLAVKLQFFGYFIVDQEAGPVEAIKKSFAATKGIWWELFIFGFLLMLINILGFLFFIVGLFATVPTTYLAMAYVYRKLTIPPLDMNPVPAKLIA